MELQYWKLQKKQFIYHKTYQILLKVLLETQKLLLTFQNNLEMTQKSVKKFLTCLSPELRAFEQERHVSDKVNGILYQVIPTYNKIVVMFSTKGLCLFCSSNQFYLLFSPYLCFIFLLYLD